MRERLRELAVVITLVALGAGGVAFDVVEEPVSRSAESPRGRAFFRRAAFCPPPVEGSEATLAIASATGADVPVGFDEQAELALLEGERLLERGPTTASGSAVTGFGAPVVASASSLLARPERGAAAAACSDVASDTWRFAEGSSVLGADQRLLLYNPFLDDAVLRVLFHTPEGVIAKAGLADVDVPPGRAVELAVNDYVLRQSLLSTSVLVTRGRVVAWRELLPAKREPPGVQMTLGAPAAAKTWYFPAGGLGEGYDERIAILNPSGREAVVTVTLATSRRVQQPRRLVEITVPPQSSRRLRLAELVRAPRDPGAVSAWVTSVNGVAVVAERTMRLERERSGGEASEIGATEAARRWVVGPAVTSPARDTLEIMNPGPDDAVVAVELLRRQGAPLRPRALEQITIPAGLRTSVSIQRWTSGGSYAAVLTSDRAVVAERSAYAPEVSDVAALMGVPVTPGAPPP